MVSSAWLSRLGLIAGLLFGFSPARSHAGALYQVTDLGNVRAEAITNSGQVLASPSSAGSGQSLLITSGTSTLVTIPGSNGTATGIVISPGGTLGFTGSYPGGNFDSPTTSARVLKDGQVSDAGVGSPGFLVGGPPYSYATAVSDGGNVAGVAHADGRWNQAFLGVRQPDGTMNSKILGALGGHGSTASGVSDQGVAVGTADTANWTHHAFAAGLAGMTDLGTLGGWNSTATAINSKGQVGGGADIAIAGGPQQANSSNYQSSPSPQHAFLTTTVGGAMQDLGTLPGDRSSEALAINSQGQVVGFSSNAGGAGQTPIAWPVVNHAFLFDHGVMTDLNSLIPAGSGWLLQQAVSINDVGQIVGTGQIDGATHSFLLTPFVSDPLPVPEPAALFAFAALGLGLVGRRMVRR
jgi:probable HAF family extracellular repeat protein